MNGHFVALEDAGKIERVSAGRAEVERLHAILARSTDPRTERSEKPMTPLNLAPLGSLVAFISII